ncbi:MAG: DUF4173 domain-containing protein [Mesorhizobium sp.]|uniref:DUF4153 domain-containing protein n=1 Tax=unclassified Mesorhizobium TaxID=325217 RepID=UPI000FD24CB6|nr:MULTISPECIES: DUF4173 domain-containing protein [unclassified Mesorhizobium]RUV00256.1 DUF4173 domain-containing protein [Mesorhizobium sp. M6A.T.Cr.TU.017.01.1.1]RWO97404.1 MAG: DUF4173 domain-containing protein [Mesorhizobium sp.]RWP71411.1 MAG: DUF4173 domain-containing protein [Mesorhizobium sp.]
MTSLLTAAPSYCARFGVAVLLAALADFFFYGQPVGITLFLFGITLAAAAAAIQPSALSARGLWLGLAALLVALLPLIENVSALSVAIGLAAMAVFALSLVGRLRHGLARIAGQVALFLLAAPLRFVHDFLRWRKAARRLGRRRIRFAAIAVWVMPLTLGAVFLALFGAANPVVEYWLSLIDLLALLEFIQLPRLAFWLLVLAGVWAFLRPRLPRVLRRIPRVVLPVPVGRVTTTKPVTAIEDIIFGKAAILRALVVFNILFAMQTALDATYLWGGIALPDGLTYAAYAHRGAYPLIVTALLAAGFVLAALRPGSTTSGDPLIRRLVYIWVAQNIMLVVSSILRLDLYIGVYALTYWRIAAFAWMGLVAAGLALIIARIALEKSNEWLLSANLLTLSVTLYACCFINFAALIANYNVEHSFEMTGQGTELDFWYLRSLGPSAWPALDRFLEHQGKTNAASVSSYRELVRLLGQDEAHYRARQENWRAWSFRDWRLLRTLDTRIPFVVPQGSEPFVPGR